MAEKTYINRAVREAQTYLRDWSRRSGSRFFLIPDGVYGRETRFTVREFQRENGLPTTGVIDLRTWDTLVADYHIHNYPDIWHTSLYAPAGEPAEMTKPASAGETNEWERRFMWPGGEAT